MTGALLVPISESVTVRQTVDYAVLRAREEDRGVHFVVAVTYEADVPEGDTTMKEANALLDRATAWAREDTDDLAIETAIVGTEEYLFGPHDYVTAFERYCEEHDIERLVLDPEYKMGTTAPLLQPLERELEVAGVTYEKAPVDRPAQHERLVGSQSPSRFLAMFGVSYVFYLVLGDPTYWFDLVTGFAVASIVAITLSQITFTTAPTVRGSPMRVFRFGLYVPYLIWEIVKANIAISLVILRPSMPIDPTLCRVRTRVRSGLPLLALSNSITLTPGTLTVRADDQRLVVHALIPEAREDLFDGALERAVRFVFYGRVGAAIATPRERGDTEVIGGEEL